MKVNLAAEGQLTLQTIAMPADTNANGDIFGGWLMAQMDLGTSVMARTRARGRVATIAVEGMTFHKPVHVGDVVSIYCEMAREGTTSMTIDTQVWVTRRLCCTNGVRGSLFESRGVATAHEQLVPYEVQDQELAFVQHGFKAARFAINLV